MAQNQNTKFQIPIFRTAPHKRYLKFLTPVQRFQFWQIKPNPFALRFSHLKIHFWGKFRHPLKYLKSCFGKYKDGNFLTPLHYTAKKLGFMKALTGRSFLRRSNLLRKLLIPAIAIFEGYRWKINHHCDSTQTSYDIDEDQLKEMLAKVERICQEDYLNGEPENSQDPQQFKDCKRMMDTIYQISLIAAEVFVEQFLPLVLLGFFFVCDALIFLLLRGKTGWIAALGFSTVLFYFQYLTFILKTENTEKENKENKERDKKFIGLIEKLRKDYETFDKIYE